ncbi:MAG TPA: hypothetical protein VGG38_14090 [Acidimicrobiales bacterium]
MSLSDSQRNLGLERFEMFLRSVDLGVGGTEVQAECHSTAAYAAISGEASKAARALSRVVANPEPDVKLLPRHSLTSPNTCKTRRMKKKTVRGMRVMMRLLSEDATHATKR